MLVDVRLNKKKTSTRTLFFSSLTTKQSLICECTRRFQSSFSRIFAVIVCTLVMLTQMTTIFVIKRLNEIVCCFACFLANASICRRRLSYCKLFSSIIAYTSEFFSNISSSQATIQKRRYFFVNSFFSFVFAITSVVVKSSLIFFIISSKFTLLTLNFFLTKTRAILLSSTFKCACTTSAKREIDPSARNMSVSNSFALMVFNPLRAQLFSISIDEFALSDIKKSYVASIQLETIT